MGKKEKHGRQRAKVKALEDEWDAAAGFIGEYLPTASAALKNAKTKVTDEVSLWEKNSTVLIFVEAFFYYLYLSYFPRFLGSLFNNLPVAFTDNFLFFSNLHENVNASASIYAVTWIWIVLLSRGNQITPELTLLTRSSHHISKATAMRRICTSFLAGFVVAIITQNVLREKLFFATWKVDQFGFLGCFAIEFGFTFVTCSTTALMIIVLDVAAQKDGDDAPPDRIPIRGLTEIYTFVVVAVIVLGLPFANGGPALNSIYSLIAAVHHRNWRMGLCHVLADLTAAVAAEWFVSVRPSTRNDTAKKYFSHPRGSRKIRKVHAKFD